METAIPFYSTQILESSYRTYEEWKRSRNMIASLGEVSSYRTYEEWKLVSSVAIALCTSSSYRTYEEWKHTRLGGRR